MAGGLVNGVNGNIVGVRDAGVGLPAFGGGPLETCDLLGYSPAINAGDNTLIPTDPVSGRPVTTDQTGARHIFGGTVDIGALELQVSPPVPSTVVNTAADDIALNGLTSLREAVGYVNRTGGTVTFDPTVFATPQDLLLLYGPILVAGTGGPVTIASPRPSLATVDTGGFFPDFLTSGTAAVSGLTITGGPAFKQDDAHRGAVANAGTLTISNCVIRDNSVSRDANQGSLTVDHSIISGDSAVSDVPAYQDVMLGGGIYSNDPAGKGPVTISNSAITGNSATGSENRGGGGIFSQDPLSIVKSTVASNSTGGLGSGVYTYAGTTVTLVNSTVAGNSASNAGGGMCLGGSTNIINSTISGNTAGYTGGVLTDVPLTVTSSTVANGSAGTGTGAGGIQALGTTLFDSIIAGNVANGKPYDLDSGVSSTSAYNLIGDAATAGGLLNGVNGHIVGADPLARPPGRPRRPDLDPGPAPRQPGPQRRRPGVAPGRPHRSAGPAAGPGRPDGHRGRRDSRPADRRRRPDKHGTAQRSDVRSLTVTFSDAVTFAGRNANATAAFQLTHVQTGNNVTLSAAVSTNAQGRTVVTLGFSGRETDPVSALNCGVPSLADGRYTLSVLTSHVTVGSVAFGGNGDGTPGSNYVGPADTYHGSGLHLYRLFGDANGYGVVDATDLGQLSSTVNANSTSPFCLSFSDADNNGAVDASDLGQFRSRFNANVF